MYGQKGIAQEVATQPSSQSIQVLSERVNEGTNYLATRLITLVERLEGAGSPKDTSNVGQVMPIAANLNVATKALEAAHAAVTHLETRLFN